MKEEFKTLQAGRALAALAVVMFHANAVLAQPKYLGAGAFMRQFTAADSGVSFFYVLSGIVMVLAHGGELGAPGAPARFLWKRFRRLYPPLWAVLAILLVMQVLFPHLSSYALPGVGAYVAAFLISPLPAYEVIPVEFTLRHEILFYGLVALCLWRPRLGAGLLAGWVVASATSLLWSPGPLVAWLLDPAHVLFGLGVGAGYLIRHDRVRRPLALAIAGGGVFALAWGARDLGLIEHIPLGIAGYGLGATGLALGFVTLERRGLRVPRWLERLGDASYAIYLVHFPIVSLCARAATWLSARVEAPALIWFLATVMICTAGGVIFRRLIERPLLSLILRPARA